MGLAVSVREMFDAARALNNAETLDEANSFVTNAELFVRLNTELAELQDVIIENMDDSYGRGRWPIDLEPNTAVYPLAAGNYQVSSVDIEWTNQITRSAHRFMEAERNRFKSILPSVWAHFGRVYYRVLGSNIEFIPTPQTAIRAYVNYEPSFTPLTSLDDTYDSQNGWHMAAVYGLAAYIAVKDKNDELAVFCTNEKEKQFTRVRSMAARRIEGEPARVQRTRRVEDDFEC